MVTAARVAFDLVDASREQLDAYLAGRSDGYLEGEAVGYGRGWTACDEEIARLQRAAHRVVQALANVPPHADAQAARRRHELEACARSERQLALAEARAHARTPEEAA